MWKIENPRKIYEKIDMKNLDIRERVTQAQAAVLSDFQIEIPKIGLIRAMKTYPPVMNSLTTDTMSRSYLRLVWSPILKVIGQHLRLSSWITKNHPGINLLTVDCLTPWNYSQCFFTLPWTVPVSAVASASVNR